MSKVLVIEDDRVLQKHLLILFKSEGLQCEAVSTLSEARSKILTITEFFAVILDWALPDGEGIEWVTELRQVHQTLPVIMLTARAEVANRVMGLKLGATDYVVKPFEPLELVARVQRQIAQATAASLKIDQGSRLTLCGIVMDAVSHETFWHGQRVDLTKLQFALLKFLMEHPGQVFSRDELLQEVWGLERYPTTRTVDNHIVQLRQKFAPELFETVHGHGYKFAVGK